MKRALLGIAFYTILMLIQSCANKADTNKDDAVLAISASFAKTVYGQGEMVEVIVELKNTSQEDLIINSEVGYVRVPFPERFNVGTILVWGPDGKEIAYPRDIDIDNSIKESDFMVLKPGETIVRKGLIRDSTEFNLYGKYTVLVTYQNYANPRDAYNSTDIRQAWQGKIESPVVYFEIQP